MSNNNKARYLNKDIIHMMEMAIRNGKLNVSLSEEGLSLDKENLKAMKNVVESE